VPTTVDKLEDNLYRVEVPLRGVPLKAVNSYIIKDGTRGLIIDPGMNRNECLEVIQDAIADIRIQFDKLDFFVTHFHTDHIGLVSAIASPESMIYLSNKEIDTVRNFKGLGFGFASEYMPRSALIRGCTQRYMETRIESYCRKGWRSDRLWFLFISVCPYAWSLPWSHMFV
jgi:hypothetical protein